MRLITSIGEHQGDNYQLYQFTEREARTILDVFNLIEDLTDHEKRIVYFIVKGINANALK